VDVVTENLSHAVSHEPREGNLYREFPDEFMETWIGCCDRDCLPKCSVNDGHCERLKLEYDAWSRRVPTINEQLNTLQRPEGS
jgi:hypothetical protein